MSQKYPKAQMEIMGLVLIVILITLGLLFVIMFSLNSDNESAKSSFTQEELASNTLLAMIHTTTDCKDIVLSDMIEYCAEGRPVSCSGYYCASSGSDAACDCVDSTVSHILNNTLNRWQKSYEYSIKAGQNMLLNKSYGTCDIYSDRKSEELPLVRVGAGQLIIKLDICD